MKYAEVKEGDILIADGGFTCIKAGAKLTVLMSYKADEFLYVPCEMGRHYLDGQLDHATGEIVGFRRA